MAKMKRLILRLIILKEIWINKCIRLEKVGYPSRYHLWHSWECWKWKSTLLNILAGSEKESSGTVLYEDNTYKKLAWQDPTPDDIFYTKNLSLNTPNSKISSYITDKFGKKKNIIKNRYFKDGSLKIFGLEILKVFQKVS